MGTAEVGHPLTIFKTNSRPPTIAENRCNMCDKEIGDELRKIEGEERLDS
jgi:hypothetical protein